MASTSSTEAIIELPSRNTPDILRSRTTAIAAAPPEQPSNDIVEASRQADQLAPEGGYGWVAVAACSAIAWWSVGTSYSWGVIQAQLVEEHLSAPSTLAFIGSLLVACVAIFALVNARVVRYLGTRRTAMLGVVFLTVGEIISSFLVHSVAGLFIGTGVITGMGVSLCFMVVSTVPAQYFWRRRGIANGIVYAGGGLGGAVICFTLNAIIENLGVAWAFRIQAMMTFAMGMPAAWFAKQRLPIRRAAWVDLSLLKDFGFIVLFLAGAIGTFPLLVPPFFLPLYSREVGLSASVGAGLVAAFNFSSALGRILCGFSCDALGPLNTLFASFLITALSMLVVWPVSTSLAPLVIFTILNGVGNGGFFATMPTVVGNIFGSARVSVVMGMIVTGWTGGYLLGAPIAGFILHASGGAKGGLSAYRAPIYFAGSMSLGAAVLVAFVRFRLKWQVFVKA